jgi:hypothetical protein
MSIWCAIEGCYVRIKRLADDTMVFFVLARRRIILEGYSIRLACTNSRSSYVIRLKSCRFKSMYSSHFSMQGVFRPSGRDVNFINKLD